MAVIIALDASPHTRPLAILLGPEIKEAPAMVPPPAAGGAAADIPRTDG